MTILISDISTGCFEGFANHRKVCEHFNSLEQQKIKSLIPKDLTTSFQQDNNSTEHKWYFVHSTNRHLRFLHDYIKHGELNGVEQVALDQELDYIELQQGQEYTFRRMAVSRGNAIQQMERWNWKYAAKHCFRIREMFRSAVTKQKPIVAKQAFIYKPSPLVGQNYA